MSVLDTHVWIWWVNDDPQLPPDYLAYIRAEVPNGLGVSAISCWEVAKSVERGRLQLDRPVAEWLALLPLTPEVAVESCQLPGTFHRDPADQIIVATARLLDVPVVTLDQLIRADPHVRLAP